MAAAPAIDVERASRYARHPARAHLSNASAALPPRQVTDAVVARLWSLSLRCWLSQQLCKSVEVGPDSATLSLLNDRVGQPPEHTAQPRSGLYLVSESSATIACLEGVRDLELQLAFDGSARHPGRVLQLSDFRRPLEAASQDLADSTPAGAHLHRP
jgi:hypothetical protein